MRDFHAKTGAAIMAVLLIAGCGKGGDATGNSAEATAAATAPAGGEDWTGTITETQDGGFMVGNPQAKVKLIEYGSMTCPHCADFATDGTPVLLERYVKDGRVSFEFRNFVRDGMDVTASLLARCGGPGPFFKLTEQMFADQRNWMEKAINLSKADQDRMKALPVADQLPALAGITGLDKFVRMRGITDARVKQCLNDEPTVNLLQKINQTAVDTYHITGTPGFVINGQLAEGVYNWETLEPRLQQALGS